jgi:hypothetical protein
MTRRLTLALAAISFAAASPAAAQFTTVVAPPKRVEAAAPTRAEQQAAAARDTAHRATLQAMSAWVDSVAGAPAPGTVTVDSANGAIATDTAATPAQADKPATTRFEDGARAPNTASPLPFILVAGLGAMLIGAAMLFTPRRAALVDARRRRAS